MNIDHTFRQLMTTDNDKFYRGAQFQAFFKNSSRSLVLKANPPYFTILAVSDNYLSLTHTQRSQLLGRGLFEVFPGSHDDLSEQNSVHSSFVRAISSKAIDELPVFKYEIYIEETQSYATEYWTNVNEPLLNEDGNVAYLINTTTNITRQVQNEQALAEAENLLQQLNEELIAANEELEAGNEELSASNEQLQFTVEKLSNVNKQLKVSQDEVKLAVEAARLATWDFNPTSGRFAGNALLRDWFGLGPDEEMALNNATDIIAEADRSRVIQAINYALTPASGGDYDTYYTIVHPGGLNPRIVRAKGKALFDEQNSPYRFSGVLQDVTELKRDEQRKNDFIGMVSHELKTPITSIQGYLQLLERRAQKAEDNFSSGILEKTIRQIGKMIAMINGFLNMSRLESGKIHIETQHFDMAELIKEVEEESLTSYTSHHMLFAPVKPTPVIADRDKIGQVITNLISNAVKYSAVHSTINISCTTQNGLAMVSIKDQGIGITEADCERLFDRYYRVESDHTNSISGFGIGLYLCKEIVERHKGTIGLKSEIGVGSTFYFTLPISQ